MRYRRFQRIATTWNNSFQLISNMARERWQKSSISSSRVDYVHYTTNPPLLQTCKLSVTFEVLSNCNCFMIIFECRYKIVGLLLVVLCCQNVWAHCPYQTTGSNHCPLGYSSYPGMRSYPAMRNHYGSDYYGYPAGQKSDHLYDSLYNQAGHHCPVFGSDRFHHKMSFYNGKSPAIFYACPASQKGHHLHELWSDYATHQCPAGGKRSYH